MKKVTGWIFAALFLIPSLTIKAEEHHEHHDYDHSDNHAAHVHGLASLTLATDNNHLEMEFESPAINLVGFEHRANSEEEINAVEQVESLLHSSAKLFAFIGTECKQTEVTVDVSSILNDSETHHDDEHEAHFQDENHSEIIASYRFHCGAIKKLNTVSVRLFELFPAMETIKAQWITDNQQGSVNLNKDNNNIHLK